MGGFPAEVVTTKLLKTYLDTTTITRATTITNSISTPPLPVTITRPQQLSNNSNSLPEAEVNTKEVDSMTNIVKTPRLNYKTTLLQLF